MAAVEGLALKELFDPKATVLTPIAGLCESAERVRRFCGAASMAT